MFSKNNDFRTYQDRHQEMLREAEKERLVRLVRAAQTSSRETTNRFFTLRRVNLRLVGLGLWRWPAREDLTPLPKAG